MSSGVVKKMFGIFDGLSRRRFVAGYDLFASEGININRIAKLIIYKSHKYEAMLKYGMKLDSFESVKERASRTCGYKEADAAIVACKTICRYSMGIGMETISDAAYKASKVLHRWGAEKRAWGSIADSGFKPANKTMKLQGLKAEHYDMFARRGYIAEVFGVPELELWRLGQYARVMFNIKVPDAVTMAGQVMAVEKIIEAAFKASEDLNLLRSGMEKPTDREVNSEITIVEGDGPLKVCQTVVGGDEHSNEYQTVVEVDELSKECQTKLSDDDSVNVNAWEPGFLECRDEMCIFMDCKEASVQYEKLMAGLNGSLPNINWARMTRFMEYKARKEYAMETYGVRLGDFHSLKENAWRLFVISEDQAENMASQTMSMDSESMAFEKIADAAFKASKILNWEVDGTNKEPWGGNITDASGFKSPKSMKNWCTNMDIEARKAYTMEAFGVSSVEVDYIKDFVIQVFREVNLEELTEAEAIIMACECFAVDHVVDATSKNLSLTVELEPMDEMKARYMDDLISRFSNHDIFVPHYTD